MRKLIPLFACLLTMLGLGVLVVENTKAEAPRTSVSSVSGGIQGSESVRTSSVTGLDRVSQLGASSTPTTCIAYTYTLSSFDLPIVTATPGAPETTAMSVVGTSTPASLPFPFTFYGVTYTSVNILNFGNLQFTTSNDSPHSCPFPFAQLGPSILPYWSEFQLHWGGSGDGPCVQNYGIPCGIYQSTTGIAPYRIYTVQWVGILYGSNHETVNFSARLYETTNVIDFVYDYGVMFGDFAAVGVQDGLGRYTAYTCNMSAQLQGRVIRWTPVITNECATETPTSTPTITLTPTPTQTCPTSWVAAPSPTWSGTGSDQLTGVDALSPNDVWAVGATSGYTGMVQHWDGTQWSAVPDDPPGYSEILEAVSALSANDIWIVGSYNSGSLGGTLTEHWDGTQWTHVLSPNGGNSTWAGLSSVSALATNDVWAVGTTDRLVYGGGTPLILHWNGTYWALANSQSLQSNLYLRSVSAIAPDDVWAVGTYLVGTTMESEVAHWDGTSWSPSPIPAFSGTFSLYGVVGISASDVWAVGYTWSQTLTMHWDGSAWSVVPSPNIGTGGNRLFAVDAQASDSVWAVGMYAPDGLSDRTLTMRWDGAAWTIVSSPSPSPRSVYQSVSVLPSGEAWTVGYNTVPSTTFSIVARYVPSDVCGTPTPVTPSPTPTACPASWVTIPSLSYNGDNRLKGVESVSSNDAWAVGVETTGSTDAILQHWDGSQWSTTPYRPPGFADSLAGVFAVSPNDVWAVGWYEGSGGGAWAEHWDGTQWLDWLGPNGGGGTWTTLLAVSGTASNDVWAVGVSDQSGGVSLILHWDGTGWSVVTSPNVGALLGVAAIAPNDAWAISGSALLHWDGSTWYQVSSPIGGAFSGISAISSNDVWVVGHASGQTLTMHWDGTAWTVVPSPNVGSNENDLYAVDSIAANDMWAVGKYFSSGAEQTLTMHWDGMGWTIVASPTPNLGGAYQAVSMLSSDEVWAVGYTTTSTTTLTLTARYALSSQCATSTPTPISTPVPTDTPTNTPTVTQTVGPGTPTATPTATDTAVGTPATPVATSTPCTINFSDVHTTDYFYEPVRYLYCAGVITGYPDNTFRPYNNASRGQLSKIVVLAEGMTINTAGGPHFNDVLVGNPFYDYIETAYNAGLINGYADGSFRWSNDVTRGQICKIVVNAEGWSIDTSGGPHFPDVEPGSTFYDYIETAYHHALINGYPDGTFGPGNPATRGQIAKIVHNAVVGP